MLMPPERKSSNEKRKFVDLTEVRAWESNALKRRKQEWSQELDKQKGVELVDSGQTRDMGVGKKNSVSG